MREQRVRDMRSTGGRMRLESRVVEFEAELRIVIARKCTERVPDALKQRIAEALDKEMGKA